MTSFDGFEGKSNAPHNLMITPQQLRKVQAKCSALGLTDRNDRLSTVSEIVGFEVGSLNDLTQSQAAVVIDALVEREEAENYILVDRSNVENDPTLSFGDDARIGDEKTGMVVGPLLVQATDYYTGELSFDRNGEPKVNLVVVLNIGGERYTLWAPKPSAMYSAIKLAEKQLGRRMKWGDILTVKFIGEIPNKNPKFNAAKQYEVTIIAKPGIPY